MSKENKLTDQRELTAEELELVSGGFGLTSVIIHAIAVLTASTGSPTCPDWACGTQK
jgi:lactobin A/cerein 7B family class IIb bacteriocin